MQLSLSTLNNPSLPAQLATPVEAASIGDATTSGPEAARPPQGEVRSFEECFTPDSSTQPEGEKPRKPELEKSAATMAASFWLQGALPVPPTPESPAVRSEASVSATGSTTDSLDPISSKLTPPGKTTAGISPPDDSLTPTKGLPQAEMTTLRREDASALQLPVPGGLPAIARNPAVPVEPPTGTPLLARANIPLEVIPPTLLKTGVPLPSDSNFPAGVIGATPGLAVSASPRIDLPTPGKSRGFVVEKIAATRATDDDATAKANPAELKEFLSTAHKTVAASVTGLGTAVAEEDPIMSPASSNRSKPVPGIQPGGAAVESSNAFTATLAVETTLPVVTLRDTMAAVVHAVARLEQRIDSQPKSVDLHLQVGSEPITLRVELKEGTVHTVFQTVSAELRSALSQEWQQVVPPAVASHLRLADPVFNAPSGGLGDSTSGSAGQGALPQRGQPNPEAVPVSRFVPQNDFQQPEPAPSATVLPPGLTLLNVFA